MYFEGFVTRSLIGFKFELNWPEDIFFSRDSCLLCRKTAICSLSAMLLSLLICSRILNFSYGNDASRQDKGILVANRMQEKLDPHRTF